MRHGQTDWNVKKLCVGQVDVPLNDNGMEQARLAAPVVQRLSISTIFHSPLERARVTALSLGMEPHYQFAKTLTSVKYALVLKRAIPNMMVLMISYLHGWQERKSVAQKVSMYFVIVS